MKSTLVPPLRRGATLVELAVVASIAFIVLAIAHRVLMGGLRQGTVVESHQGLLQSMQVLLAHLELDLARARPALPGDPALARRLAPGPPATGLEFLVTEASGAARPVRYEFVASGGSIQRDGVPLTGAQLGGLTFRTLIVDGIPSLEIVARTRAPQPLTRAITLELDPPLAEAMFPETAHL